MSEETKGRLLKITLVPGPEKALAATVTDDMTVAEALRCKNLNVKEWDVMSASGQILKEKEKIKGHREVTLVMREIKGNG